MDGAILTKMDGTAKGGIIFPLYKELGIPVKFIGVGEDLDDLYVFNRQEYIQGLLGIPAS
jgi:fused signal recognition particle receptor